MASPARMLLDLDDALGEAERKVSGSARLWQREWASSALRAIRRGLLDLTDHDTEALEARLSALEKRLRAMDESEFGGLHKEFSEETMTPQRFGELLAAVPAYEWDAFTERLLGIHEVPAASKARGLEMIKYQATPMASILELVGLLGPDDVLFDMGSGLGKVSMLSSFLSLARAVGVEFDPAYGERAAARASALKLKRVRFEVMDAREADYRAGTFFYFFFPFEGEVMTTVLDRIRSHTSGRSIRFAALHRSTLRFDQEDWLTREGAFPSGMALYRTQLR